MILHQHFPDTTIVTASSPLDSTSFLTSRRTMAPHKCQSSFPVPSPVSSLVREPHVKPTFQLLFIEHKNTSRRVQAINYHRRKQLQYRGILKLNRNQLWNLGRNYGLNKFVKHSEVPTISKSNSNNKLKPLTIMLKLTNTIDIN